MRRLAAILIALALLPQPAPPFTATWLRPGVARLSWVQPANVHETCLVRVPSSGISVLIGCWEDLPAGATGLTLGDKGPLDGSFRPTAGDRYELQQDNATASAAQLRGVAVLPVVRR